MAFQGFTPFGVCGGPEKDRDVCFVVGVLRTLSPDSSCQLNIFRHDGNSPGVDSTQVGIIKQPDNVCLRCLLETQYCRRLESQVCLDVLGDLSHHPLERQLSDEQCCTPLEVTNVLQSHSFLLCTGEVLLASPASVPRGSFSSAHPSSLVHGGPTRFSPWDERCKGVAASD